jgi:hypothetical protein
VPGGSKPFYAWLKKPRQQEDLVRDPLHAPAERVREAAREVDQALRELGIGALEVHDHRHGVLELVGDRLGVVEPLRHDEVHLDRGGGDGLEPPVRRRAHRRGLRAGVRVGPVFELVPLAGRPRVQAPDVLPVAVVGPLQLLLGRVGLFVPVLVLLDDAEVDEGAAPDVTKSHDAERY